MAVVPTVPMVPAGALPGIDVSNHQGAIDWSLVAASGTRFAFAKATEGRTFNDPMYATNKAGAALAGVVFGAYHFARPDDTANDAVIEADHFVDVAQLEPGNLLPVLDIESTGGLTQAQVTQWILAWLDRVTVRLGVRPIVYTSPNGWRTGPGARPPSWTPATACSGWRTGGWRRPPSPRRTGAATGGRSGSTATAAPSPGIDGCVDVDWYETGSFDPVTSRAPDDVPPAATFACPATPGDPVVIFGFSEIVHQVTPENAFVWIPGTGTYPDVELSCRSGKGADVDCVSGNVRTALVRPLDPFVLGETYEAVVNPPIAPVLVVVGARTPSRPPPLGSRCPPRSRRTAPRSPTRGARPRTRAPRAVATRSSIGPARPPRSPSRADRSPGTRPWDRTGARPRSRSTAIHTARSMRTRRGRTSWCGGPSTDWDPARTRIRIRVLGRARASATDTQVVVDAFRAGGELAANPDLRATWGTVGRGGASGGSVGLERPRGDRPPRSGSEGPGSSGSRYRGPDQGRAEVYLGRVARPDGRRLRGGADVRRRTIVHRSGGRRPHAEDRRARDRPSRCTGKLVSVDRFSIVP